MSITVEGTTYIGESVEDLANQLHETHCMLNKQADLDFQCPLRNHARDWDDLVRNALAEQGQLA